ncbi:MAG TPA: ATP synthase subunit I [Solimonas sp.]|nr:ATP synthase subunit I [Solimonas sp.]
MNRVHLRGISLAWAVIAIQGLIGGSAALLMALLRGRAEASAALFGALVAVAPNAWFALRLFARRTGAEPREIVGQMFRAEIGKFALTAVLFFFGVALFAGEFLPLLCTYVACLAAYWVVTAVARID